MSEKLIIPEYNVIMATDEPYTLRVQKNAEDKTVVVEGLAWIGAVKPSFEPAENYFVYATLKNGTGLRNLYKVAGDIALVFELSVDGTGNRQRSQLEQTVEDMSILANAWKYPKEASRLYHPDQFRPGKMW